MAEGEQDSATTETLVYTNEDRQNLYNPNINTLLVFVGLLLSFFSVFLENFNEKETRAFFHFNTVIVSLFLILYFIGTRNAGGMGVCHYFLQKICLAILTVLFILFNWIIISLNI